MASTENFNAIHHFTSGGVGTFGDRLSTEGFEFGEERSSESRELGVGDAELGSDLLTALLNFATLGVAGDDFPGGVVSDKLVLFPQTHNKEPSSERKQTETICRKRREHKSRKN